MSYWNYLDRRAASVTAGKASGKPSRVGAVGKLSAAVSRSRLIHARGDHRHLAHRSVSNENSAIQAAATQNACAENNLHTTAPTEGIRRLCS